MMKKHLITALTAVVALSGAGVAAAQPDWNHGDRHDNGRHEDNGRHNGWNQGQGGWHSEWRRGYRMDHGNWDHAQRVDWRRYHLRRPPAGYEWREVNGNYVLAAVATGLIADLIMNSR